MTSKIQIFVNQIKNNFLQKKKAAKIGSLFIKVIFKNFLSN